MRDLYAELYERRFRRREFLQGEADPFGGDGDPSLVGQGGGEVIADIDECGDEARPTLRSARASTLDLSLTPILPFLRGTER